MTEQYKPRPASIVNRITPLQSQAWQAEHIAIEVEQSGHGAFKSYYLDIAKELRKKDQHNKIQELFNQLDAQNIIIEIGLGMAQPVPILEPQIDYSLMQQ